MRTDYVDPAGNHTIYTYDPRDLLQTSTLLVGGSDPQLTQFEYNDRGQVTKVTYADSKFVIYEYDAYGSQTARVDELGHRWTTTYDEFKRHTSSSQPPRASGLPSLITIYGYEEAGGIGGGGCCGGGGSGAADRPTSIILPSLKTTLIAYDGAWRKITEIVGAGTTEAATTQYGYDGAANLARITDPRGKLWKFTYDSLHRRLTATDPLDAAEPGQHTMTWTYDAAGNKLTEKRPDAGTTVNAFDLMDHMISSRDPKQQTTLFSYGGVAYGDGTFGDNLVLLRDANSNDTFFTYDLANRKTSMIYPDGSHEDWTYLSPGTVRTYRTRAGQIKTMTYDPRNRETLADWDDSTPDVTMTYDFAGRLMTMLSNVSALSYSYDNANNLLSETQDLQAPVDLPPKIVAYTYDLDGNRGTLTYPGGTRVTYGYTARNQIKDITADGPPPLASYTYDIAGNRIGFFTEVGANNR